MDPTLTLPAAHCSGNHHYQTRSQSQNAGAAAPVPVKVDPELMFDSEASCSSRPIFSFTVCPLAEAPPTRGQILEEAKNHNLAQFLKIYKLEDQPAPPVFNVSNSEDSQQWEYVCRFSELISKLANEKEIRKLSFISHDEVAQKLNQDPELRDWLVSLQQKLNRISSTGHRKTRLLALWLDQTVVDFSSRQTHFADPGFFNWRKLQLPVCKAEDTEAGSPFLPQDRPDSNAIQSRAIQYGLAECLEISTPKTPGNIRSLYLNQFELEDTREKVSQLSEILQKYLKTTHGKGRLDHERIQQHLLQEDEELYDWLVATSEGEKEQHQIGTGKNILVGLWLDVCIDSTLPRSKASGKGAKSSFHWRGLKPSQPVISSRQSKTPVVEALEPTAELESQHDISTTSSSRSPLRNGLRKRPVKSEPEIEIKQEEAGAIGSGLSKPAAKKSRRERESEQQSTASAFNYLRRWALLSSQCDTLNNKLLTFKEKLPESERDEYMQLVQAQQRNVRQLKDIVIKTTGFTD